MSPIQIHINWNGKYNINSKFVLQLIDEFIFGDLLLDELPKMINALPEIFFEFRHNF